MFLVAPSHPILLDGPMAQALVRYQFYHLWARLKGQVLAVELQMIRRTQNGSEVRNARKLKMGSAIRVIYW